jgi:pyruvate dehydrogenase E2 component (dihydrolipoamide acetyltransferase)
MPVKEVRLPELGEDIESGDVVEVLVSKGDEIEQDQSIIEVETEKAAVEIPAPFSGTVEKVEVKAGDTVKVGQTLITVETGEKEEEEKEGEADKARKKRDETEEKERKETEGAEEGRKTESDGWREAEADVEESRSDDREEEGGQAAADEEERETGGEAKDLDKAGGGESENEEWVREGEKKVKEIAPAGPASRRLARELGVSINDVEGSGPRGRISEQDVKNHARRVIRKAEERGGREDDSVQRPSLPDFERWGEINRRPMSALRRTAAERTGTSWALIPHVTQCDRADITQLEQDRKELSDRLERERDGAKLTVTAILIKVTALALKRFPHFNVSLDVDNQEIIHKLYVNIGVAVDTDRGLVVPVVRNADRKTLTEIAVELTDLARRARGRKLGPESMRGSNFSITNLGGLGTTNFTPLVTWPEIAVLGISRAEMVAVPEEDGFVPRLILPLAVSYDHRAVDGAAVSRFLRWIAECLEKPLKIIMEV